MDNRTIYTNNMVISAEYKVFKTVGFKMPLNTPLTCIELLLAMTNCRDEVEYEIALLLLDIAFLQVRISHFYYNYLPKKSKKTLCYTTQKLTVTLQERCNIASFNEILQRYYTDLYRHKIATFC